MLFSDTIFPMKPVLLAEDNAVNCIVIQEQLRVLGYSSEVAKDGLVALQMWQSGGFSLLLTDCNMPVMDGFELASTIRQQEQAGMHIPIVAVTANVTKSDVQRCQASGMDDYLSKPLRITELAKMLERWLPEQSGAAVVAAPASTTAPAETPAVAVWDVQVLVNLVGDDTELQRSVLADFLRLSNVTIGTIHTAIEAGNAKQAGDEAHKLKSSSRTVGAMLLGDCCQKLESAGRADDMQSCLEIIGSLDHCHAEATQAITQYLR